MPEEIDRTLERLEVCPGDILVLRTRSKLQPATAARWQDELIGMCRDAGVSDVTVLVLDDCTELSIETPDTRVVQQRRERPQAMRMI